jgi:hypothetical protein
MTTSSIEHAEAQWAILECLLRPVLERDGVTEAALEWIVADLRPRMIEMMLRPAAPAGLVQMMRLERELYEARFGVSVATPERQAEWAAAMPAAGAMTRQ